MGKKEKKIDVKRGWRLNFWPDLPSRTVAEAGYTHLEGKTKPSCIGKRD